MLIPPRGHLVRPSMATPASANCASQPKARRPQSRRRDVHRSASIMRRDGAAGQLHGLQRVTAQKQEQHAARADVVSAEPLIAINAVEPEHLFVERTRALERVHVKHRFQHAEQVGHGGSSCNRHSDEVAHYSRTTRLAPRNDARGYFIPKPERFRAPGSGPACSPIWRRPRCAAARKPRGSSRCIRDRRDN